MRPITPLAAALASLLATATAAQTFEQTGSASWYGDRHHGRRTASGERFDMHKLSAAHPKLPLGSVLEVTNLANNRTVRLRVNDRGPYRSGRILDVSRAAAEQLGFISAGTAQVRIRVVGEDATDDVAVPIFVEPVLVPPSVLASTPTLTVPAPTRTYVVRIGAYAVKANAESAVAKLAAVGPITVVEEDRNGRTLHLVSIPGWFDLASAQAARDAAVDAGFSDAQVDPVG